MCVFIYIHDKDLSDIFHTGNIRVAFKISLLKFKQVSAMTDTGTKVKLRRYKSDKNVNFGFGYWSVET